MINNSEKPRILVLGSGTKNRGGSGPRMLIESVKSRVLNATIAGLVTNYPDGGVARLGREYSDLFITTVIDNFPVRKEGEKFSDDQIAEIRGIYKLMVDIYGGIESIDYIFPSGWMKYISGLPTEKVVNIHPSRVDKTFGGEGKYGDKAHIHTFEAYKRGEIKDTAITMHFVDPIFDNGPIIAQQRINLEGCISWEEAKARVVGQTEHKFQLAVTQALLGGRVVLEDGKVVWCEDFQFTNPDYYKGGIDWNK